MRDIDFRISGSPEKKNRYRGGKKRGKRRWRPEGRGESTFRRRWKEGQGGGNTGFQEDF